jgi:dienelactone hydrolase
MVRLDPQLTRMMEDARSREKTAGIELDARAMMLGFSASGMFVTRFVFMHPELVQAAAIGSPGAWPIAPVSVYHDQKLRYPVGVADFEQVTGKPFDLAEAAKVPQMIFMGDQDSNDSVIYNDSFEDRDRITIFKLFGPTLMARWPTAIELYHQNLPLVEFKLYPGASHSFRNDMKLTWQLFSQSTTPSTEDPSVGYKWKPPVENRTDRLELRSRRLSRIQKL